MTWLELSEAATVVHHDVQKARERLERAISKAWLERIGGLPQQTLDPNVPLRVQVMPAPGLRMVGRDWLHNPILDWETSEIDCVCTPWRPSLETRSTAPATQCRAKIKIWSDDLARLWGGQASAKYGPNIEASVLAMGRQA